MVTGAFVGAVQIDTAAVKANSGKCTLINILAKVLWGEFISLETVAPIGALCVDTPSTTAHRLIQAFIYIHTSLVDWPETGAARLAEEGAESVDADTVVTGAGISALIYIFT